MTAIEPPANPLSQRMRVGKRLPDAQVAAERRSKSAWLTLGVLGPLALLVGWRVLTIGLADDYVDSDPQRALEWRPDHPDALFNAADADYQNHKFPQAKALALRAIARYPLDGSAYRELAGVADFLGDHAEAKRLFDIAVRLSPRDMIARSRLIGYDIKAGQMPQAMHQVDVLLRIWPEIEPDLLSRLGAIAGDPVVLPSLGKLLVARPPWRENFLRTLAASGIDPDAIDRVFASRGADEPLSSGIGTEADLLIDRQIKDGRWEAAYVDWVGTLSKSERTVLGNIDDGGFVFQPSNKRFGWQIPDNGTGYDMSIAPRTQFTTDNVLHIAFNGLPLDYQPIRQQLVLEPGHYRMTGMGQAEAMSSEDELRWVVACAEGTQQVLAKSRAFTGNVPWNAFAFEFDVPETDCGGQWLRLDLGTGNFKGQPLDGGAIFDNLQIIRLGEQTSASIDQPASATQ